jgi:hypothetical protein
MQYCVFKALTGSFQHLKHFLIEVIHSIFKEKLPYLDELVIQKGSDKEYLKVN